MLPRIHRVVFVEIEGDDIGKAEPLLPMHPNQLAIHPDRGRAGGEAEHRALPGGAALPDHLSDPERDHAADPVVVIHYDRADAFLARTRVSRRWFHRSKVSDAVPGP